MTNLPPIPEIDGDVDLLLEVYTHASLRPSHTQMNAEYGDTDRLAELGANALDLAVTNHLCLVRPFLSATEIHDRKNDITSDTNIDIWLGLYRMKEKLKFAPTETDVLNDPVEMKKFFHIFLGAIFIRNGLPSIQSWISALIDWSLPSATNGPGNGNNLNTGDIDMADNCVQKICPTHALKLETYYHSQL